MTPARRAATGSVEVPRLVVITDTTVAPLDVLVRRISTALARARPGTVMVQLRDRQLPGAERLRLGQELVAPCRRQGHRLVVNDRADLAVVLGADGVHLGEGGVDVAEVRSLLPPSAFVTRACHDPEGVGEGDPDAVLLSPVVASRKGRPALGLAGIAAARARIANRGRPLLYALGGVDASSAAACLEAGADGVAVIGAVATQDDPEPLLRALGIAVG